MVNLSDDTARFTRGQLLIGCDLMKQQLHGLLSSHGKVALKIHTIRKHGKTLRGGFALFQLGKSASPEIQVIGRLLAGPRDAVSRMKTWNAIAWDGGPAAAAIHALLHQQTHSAARRPPPESVTWCIERVAIARKSLEELAADTLTERITHGLETLEARIISRSKKIDIHGEEDFHDARKAFKAYLGAISFLPPETITIHPKFKAIPELLGDENDIATLSEWLTQHGFTPTFVPELWSKLHHARMTLRTQSLEKITHLLSTAAIKSMPSTAKA